MLPRGTQGLPQKKKLCLIGQAVWPAIANIYSIQTYVYVRRAFFI